MLDAYIIEDIKRQEEARQREERERRPRLHIEPERPQIEPERPLEEDEAEEATIHIDISAPTIRIRGR